MNCNEARERMADRLAGTGGTAELERHVAQCEVCRQEWQDVSRTWDKLPSWPEEEPSQALRARFYQMLEAYEEGLRDAGRTQKGAARWSWWWPRQPVLQVAGALALLVAGVFAGNYAPWERREKQEVATLRSEVQNMRQLVALSLLQQQGSASDRLRGVTWSYRVQSSDTEVLSALLRTVNTDPNVNVRLSAVDALKQFDASPIARRGIAQSLHKQDSPLVQVALLDVIRDLRDRDALADVQELAADPNADPTVKQQATRLITELGH
jgi:HEAT repeats